MSKNYNWDAVALVGYAGTGKDTVAGHVLEGLGYTRSALGDLIKRDADPIVMARLGFSAFTEDRDEKAIIRPMLEWMGEAMGASYVAEHMANLPERSYNARLMRVDEAKVWRERSHPIIYIEREGVGPATKFEAEAIAGVMPFVTHIFRNEGSLEQSRGRFAFWLGEQQVSEG